MNIPRKVRIGGVDYCVDTSTTPVIVDGKQCYGSIEYASHQILIDETLGDHAHIACTLLHEVLHGIVHDRMIDFEDDEEDIIDAFARGLYQVLADNPDLMKRGK